MKYPKFRCATYVVLLAGLAAAGIPAASAEPKGNGPRGNNASPPSPSPVESAPPLPSGRPFDDTKRAVNQSIDDVRANIPAAPTPPAPPSNVRIKVQTLPPGADPGSLPTGRINAPLSAPLDTRNFAPTLRTTPVAMRARVVADVEARLHAAESTLDLMEKSESQMSADNRAQFKSAAKDAKEKAKALRRSAQAARKANDQGWESARAQLAADYDAYSAAMVRIDRMGGLPVPHP